MSSRLIVVLVSLLLTTPAVIFWLWLVIQPKTGATICPEECRCKKAGINVNCSGSGLNNIPLNVPTNVRQLLLDGNSIAYFENDSFLSRGLVDLQVINADFCELRKIDFGAFNGLKILKYLTMQGNLIREILPGTFEKNSRLEYLNLDHNIIERLESDVFYGLVNLKHISLEGNDLHYLHPDTFLGLPNFQRLYLSKNSGFQVPTDRHFINSYSLKQLGISGCNVRSVSVETFANVSELQAIDLSYNNLKILDMNILKVVPKLSILRLKSNWISVIIPGRFRKISLLEYLYLDRNRIEQLESDAFYGLVNLKYIDLRGNELQFLDPDTFVGVPNLQTLHLSNNAGLQIATDRHFINSHSLKELGISGCNVHSVSVETFANVSALERLDLSFNYLRILDMNILKVLPELSILRLNHNGISDIISGTIDKFSRLEYLRLDHNITEHLEVDLVRGLVNLKYINLEGNQLQYLNPDTFLGLPKLQGLYLSNNPGLQIPFDRHFINSLSLKQLDISACNVSSVSVETFSKVSALEWLDLSFNYLRSLDINILKVLPKLLELKLNRNWISEIIEGTFAKISRLEYLHLEHNIIEHLEVDVFTGLVNLKYVDLEGNKLQCVNPNTFLGLPKLQRLFLSKNSALYIQNGRNFINSHSLKLLDISGCNVSSVSVETFANVSALETIDLRFNYLSSLDMNILKVLPNLSVLNLKSNWISEIIPGKFEKTSLLEYLHLDDNRIDHIEFDVFSGLVNLKYIYMEGNQLQYLHPDTFIRLPKLQSLILSKNSGLHVPTDRHFINSHSLKHFGISGCNISSVSVETFANVSALELLDLSYNDLRTVDINILKVLPELSVLKLEGNEISEIIPGTFEMISRLQYLDLDHNKIEHLEGDLFNVLVNLKYIHLQGNQLQYLHPETFVGLPNLQSLSLSKNSGLQIPTDRHFINSYSLKHLGISGCNVSSVSVETFANVSALEWLSLRQNNLRSVDINILKALPKLSALYLYGNPLHCDCQLQEVWLWCQDHNIQTADKVVAPECDTPKEVKGLWWGVLEKSQCIQDNIQYYWDYINTRFSYTPVEGMGTDIEKEMVSETEQRTNFSSFLKQHKLPISVFIFILGTTGNVIIIIIVICNKDMRTLPNIYIFNVAVSDIIILMANFSETWPDTITIKLVSLDTMCRLLPFCYRMSVGLTTYSIALLSIQRYRVTVNPLQVRLSSQPTRLSTVATVCGIWIVAALFAIPATVSKYLCGDTFLFYRTNYYQHVALFQLLVSCVLPLSVIAFSYIMMARHLVESSRSFPEDTQNPRLNTRKNTAKVVLGLTVIFLISYMPVHIFETYVQSTKTLDISSSKFSDELVWFDYLRDINVILHLLLSINSCLNPVALFCTSRAFRRHIKRYVTCCCKTKSSPTDFELTRRN